MKRSKNLALMFLLGAVLVGGVAGFTAYPVIVRDSMCSEKSRESMRERLADDLALTAEQRAAVDSVLDRRHREFQTLMEPIRPEMDAARLRARTEIARVLDVRQREQFDRMTQESDARRQREAASAGGAR